MKNIIFVCFLYFAVTYETQATCKEGWVEFSGIGQCYFISGNKETWHSALDLCNSGGGYLVRIDSRAENEYLKMRARSTNATCKEGWVEFSGTGHCYFISGNKETWHSALDLCNSGGGYLVRIDSRAENEYLKMRARSTNANIWIDGTDQAQEGTWVYGSTQTPIGFTDWNPGEPNNRDHHCLGMYRTFDYKWDDYACSDKRLFICEMKPEEVHTCPQCSCCCGR